jgi:predicted secreted protein
VEVEARCGRPFELALDQYGGAGYTWQVEALPSGLRRLESPLSPPDGAASPGSPKRRTFRFVADRQGRFEIVMAAKRSWETEPAERRTFQINVAPAS